MAEVKRQCKGTSRQTGERCRCKAVPGSDYCIFHGGGALGNKGGAKRGHKKAPGSGSPPPKGNTNSLKHGAYSSKLPQEELKVFEQILDAYLADVPNPSVTDRRALERLAILETKWQVAVTQGAPADALDVLHRLLHRELKALQVTRESKDTARTSGTTPAEVVAAMLLKINERRQLPADRASSPRLIEAEVVDGSDDESSEEDAL